MYKKVYELIKSSNKIIIIRHKNPDYDAYGAQLGLYYSLKETFKDKIIYVDGDENENNIYNKRMDKLTVEDYKGSLVILVDQSSLNMLNDENFRYANKTIILDHHENTPDFGDEVVIKSYYSSASEMVTEFIKDYNLVMTKDSANALFTGIVGDSARFYFHGTSSNTFLMAAYLVDRGADILEDYKKMYKDEKESEKKIKGYVLSNFIIEDEVAYVFIPKEVRNSLDITTNYASRACVNLMSGIVGVNAYVNFTESDENSIYVEIRSREASVLNVAKEFGGGGHAQSCGTKIYSKDKIKEIVSRLNQTLKEHKSEHI